MNPETETETRTSPPPETPPAYRYFKKSLVNQLAFTSAGMALPFQTFPGHSVGLARFDPAMDGKLIAGCEEVIKAKRGGVTEIKADEYEAAKKKLASGPSARRYRPALPRLFQPVVNDMVHPSEPSGPAPTAGGPGAPGAAAGQSPADGAEEADGSMPNAPALASIGGGRGRKVRTANPSKLPPSA